MLLAIHLYPCDMVSGGGQRMVGRHSRQKADGGRLLMSTLHCVIFFYVWGAEIMLGWADDERKEGSRRVRSY